MNKIILFFLAVFAGMVFTKGSVVAKDYIIPPKACAERSAVLSYLKKEGWMWAGVSDDNRAVMFVQLNKGRWLLLRRKDETHVCIIGAGNLNHQGSFI